MSGIGLSDLAMVAILGAFCAAVFGYISNRLRDWQEQRRRIVGEFEAICDNYMKIVAEYWSSPVDDDNRRLMRPLEGRIAATGLLLARFVGENFGNHAGVCLAFEDVRRDATGGDFGSGTRDADRERMTISIAAIVKLRFAARK